MKNNLKFTEQEFKDRAYSSVKFGSSYVGGGMFILPYGSNGWKIVNGRTWETLLISDNLDKLYWYVV